MPDLFAEREEGFEAKWAHDAELAFKVQARTIGLLGNWAAHQLGLSSVLAEDYAAALVRLALPKKEGADPVTEKLRQDFAVRGLALTDETLKAKSAAFLEIARKELGALPP